MKTLFISTYNELITIAIINDEVISLKEKISNRDHSIYTVPLIDELLKECNLKPQDLNEILVINGPGSFTGIRLGITVAKTLAYTLEIPIKEITSIDALAVSDNHDKKIITISDAKGKYFGIYKNNQLKEDLKYLKEDDFDLYIKKEEYHDYLVLEEIKLDLAKIYEYSKTIKETPAHAVKAVYIKELDL